MPTLSELTSQIVDARDSRRKSFAEKKSQLDKMTSVVECIDKMSTTSLWRDIITTNNLTDLWNKTLNAKRQLENELFPFVSVGGGFTLAYERTTRDFVNIGTVGITREGKSKYIDQTTKLGEWLLPKRDGQEPCTTAPINVINGASKAIANYPSKENFVRVTHFTVTEFVELLRTYIKDLGGDPNLISLTNLTRSGLRNWIKANIEGINEALSKKLTDNNSARKRSFIEGYFTHVDDYVDYLVEDPSRNDLWTDYDIEEINKGGKIGKEYYSSVSYYDRPDASLKSKTYRSFATKKADIYTSFDVAGEVVQNIQFLDTPGIGEQKIGLERSLSENVAMNLDVILVVKSVRADLNNQETNRNTLVTLIRRTLDGKAHGKDSVFVLLNMWPNVTYQDGLDEYNRIQTALMDVHSASQLSLSEDHYKMINVQSNYETLSDDSFDHDNPIGKYLHHILSSLVPNIARIDSEYFEAAEKHYSEVEQRFRALKTLVIQLSNSLPQMDINDRIDNVLKGLYEELEGIFNSKYAIDGDIAYTIEKQFCEQPTGIVLSKFLGVDKKQGVQNINDYQQVSSFCEQHKDALLKVYKRSAYLGHLDFQTYSMMKLEFCKFTENEIYSLINTNKADSALLDLKHKLAKAFIKIGRLGFIEANENYWWEKMTELLEQEKTPASLLELFGSISAFSIDYKGALQSKLAEIMLICKHKDNFGNPALYNFEEYDSAVIAVSHSLLHIEQAIQYETDESAIKGTLDALVKSFDELLSKLIRAISLPNPSEKTEVRRTIERFYKKHANEIFIDDNESRRLALITSWNNIIQ